MHQLWSWGRAFRGMIYGTKSRKLYNSQPTPSFIAFISLFPIQVALFLHSLLFADCYLTFLWTCCAQFCWQSLYFALESLETKPHHILLEKQAKAEGQDSKIFSKV